MIGIMTHDQDAKKCPNLLPASCRCSKGHLSEPTVLIFMAREKWLVWYNQRQLCPSAFLFQSPVDWMMRTFIGEDRFLTQPANSNANFFQKYTHRHIKETPQSVKLVHKFDQHKIHLKHYGEKRINNYGHYYSIYYVTFCYFSFRTFLMNDKFIRLNYLKQQNQPLP